MQTLPHAVRLAAPLASRLSPPPSRRRRVLARALALCLSAAFASGCGYSEQEWQAQMDQYNRLKSDHDAQSAKLAKVQAELDQAKKRVADLEGRLQAAGLDIGKLSEDLQASSTKISNLSSTLEEQERALAAYRERARQLEQIRARFELLRKKLDELTKLGLAVNIRKNRMVISLPGDVLFDSGKDKLRKDGQSIVEKVATVIKNDPSLLSRDYQVAGHTDNEPLKGGPFRDNWGLSLMRAREVLLHLIEKGGMPASKWSAAGFGETDPVAPNDTPAGRQKNRRVELVVVPSVEEMLDIKAIAR